LHRAGGAALGAARDRRARAGARRRLARAPRRRRPLVARPPRGVRTLGRDLVGYGRARPIVVWPGNATVALSLIVNYEEGSESAWPERSEGRGETPRPCPHEPRDLAAES